jgi:hypothetical protein
MLQKRRYGSFRCINTEKETWNHYYCPNSKCKSMELEHWQSLATGKFKMHPAARKVMLLVLRDSQESVIQQYQQKVQPLQTYT